MNAPDGTALIAPDSDAIHRYVDLVFGYLEGRAPVRVLAEKGTPARQPEPYHFDIDERLADRVVASAEHAAAAGAALYVVPAAVRGNAARAEDIVETAIVVVDLDAGNIDSKRNHLVRHLGEPTLEIASGGVTEDGRRKRHLYWRLTEAAAGEDLARVRAIRETVADKVGGDRSFARLHQPIRVAGSVHGKFGRKASVEILAERAWDVDLGEFEEAVHVMPSMEGVARDRDPGREHPGLAAEELFTQCTREGAQDAATRFEALSKVIGWWVRLARINRISIEEAWEAVLGYNAARIVPPWDEARLEREFRALLRVDMRKHPESWAMRASAVSSARATDESDAQDVPGRPDPGPDPAELSEDALAAVFTARHAGHWRYVAAWRSWMKWDGVRWRLDETQEVIERLRRVCRLAEGLGAKKNEARKIGSDKVIRAVERIARSDPSHATTAEAWDADPMLLNTADGIVDLGSGEILAHAPARLITHVAAASPGGICPLWHGFIDEITGGDAELAGYLQRLAGLCLTGDVSEQAFFFAYGGGANGKSVFISVLAHVLGGYAVTAPLDAFMAARGDRASADLAGLRGARLVSVTETEPGRSWAESRLKQVTGGDRIRARHLYGHYFEFDPAFKLIIAGNHRPTFSGVSVAMRRRLHLIPFEVTIPPERRDRRLTEKLKAEADGILSWMLEGCAEWHRIGLSPPARVVDASDEYFSDLDHVGRWIEDDCVVGADHRTASATLFESWSHWADRMGVSRGSEAQLREALKARGFERFRTGRARGWKGLARRGGAPRGADEEER